MSCVLELGCRLLDILVFLGRGYFVCLFIGFVLVFFKRVSLITTQVSLIYTKIIKDVSLGKAVSTATSCFCLIQVICL